MNNIKPYTYLLKFKPTGQLYYGSRIKNVKLGLTPEEDFMKKYATSSKKINQLVEEFGVDAFEWKIRTHNTEQQATAWETRFLKRCKVLEHPDVWFNRNITGHILATEESNKKISEYHTGKPKSEDHKQKLSESLMGKNIGKVHTEETKQKISNATSGENNPRYGVEVSNETRAKISAGNKGKTRSEEFKKNLSEKQKGKKRKPFSEEWKANMKAARANQVRKPHTEETKQKMREARLNYLKDNPVVVSQETKQKISSTSKGKPKPAGFGDNVALRMKTEFTENNPNKREDLKKICPKCNKKVGPSNFTRWHGDRCSAVKKLT